MSDEFEIFNFDSEDTMLNKLPPWPEFADKKKADISIKMYRAICKRRDDIKSQLSDGIVLTTKNKKIITSLISKEVGKNNAYLNSREFPTIMRFIKETNEQLARLKPTGSKSPKLKSIGVDALKQRVKNLEQKLLKNQLEELLDSRIIGQLGIVKEQNIKLIKENEKLNFEIKKHEQAERERINEISDLLTEIKILKKQVRDLGGKPESSRPLRSVK